VNAGQWARAYRAMVDELERIDAEQRAQRRDWVDQVASPLGRRRHCAAVKRRIAIGDGSAAIVGRRHLLSDAALSEELATLSSRPRAAAAKETTASRLRARLGLAGGKAA
jgi:hypothetical protein